MSTISITDEQRRLTLIASLVVFFLGALDMTILSTAMPRIIEELNGIELYAWVTTAYMLTSTVLVPIFGKLGDIYGRKVILVWGISIFLLGSALSGLSGEFGTLPIIGDGIHQLIVFRALKGVGGAALFTCVIAVIADLYPPLQRAKFMGLFGAVFGVSSVIGPFVGGLLTDYATVTLFGHEIPGWRWVFYVNLPLGLFSLYLIVRKTPRTNHAAGGKIDYLGAALFIGAFIPLLLALTWGGHKYEWQSWQISALFGGALMSLAAFVVVEKLASNPIMPLQLFAIRAFTVTNLAAFVTGMAFLGIVMFMPLYMQVVIGVSATNSGFAMFPLMLGMMTASIASGRLVSRLGVYKSFMVGGGAIAIVGVALLTQVGPDASAWDLAWRMVIVGIGLGPMQGLANLVVQNAVSMAHMGAATSATQFFRQIGSTVGIALFGTFLTHNLTIELPKQLPNLNAGSEQTANLDQAQSNAMNLEQMRAGIIERFDEFYVVIDKAFHGDQEAIASVNNNALVPPILKQLVAQGQGKPEAELEKTLTNVKTMLAGQAKQTADNMERGLKVAFSNSITSMFSAALWIVLAAFLITCFIPVISLRAAGAVEAAAKAAAAAKSKEQTAPPSEGS
ncbi:MDR family MFS transporter [Aurantivibrio plasticivorans]